MPSCCSGLEKRPYCAKSDFWRFSCLEESLLWISPFLCPKIHLLQGKNAFIPHVGAHGRQKMLISYQYFCTKSIKMDLKSIILVAPMAKILI